MLLVAEEQHETESRFLFRTIGGGECTLYMHKGNIWMA